MTISMLRRAMQDDLRRNSVTLMANYALTSGLGFLFWLLAARTFAAADVGTVSALVSSLTLVATFASLGLPNAVLRYLATETAPRQFLRHAYLTVTATAAVAVVVVAAVPGTAGLPLAALGAGTAVVALGACAVAMTVGMVADAAIVARRRPVGVLVKNAVASVVRIALLPVAALAGALGLFATFAVSATVATGLGVWFASHGLQAEETAPHHRRTRSALVAFTGGNYVAMVVSIVPVSVLPVLVYAARGPSEAAFVAMPLLIVGALNAVSGTTAQSLFAELSAHRSTLRAGARHAVTWCYVLLVPCVGAVVALADVILLLFGPEYSSSGATCLRLMALGCLFGPLSYVADVMLNSSGRVGAYTIVNVLGAVVVVLALVVAVPSGPDAVGFAWLLGQAAYAAIALVAVLSRNGRATGAGG